MIGLGFASDSVDRHPRASSSDLRVQFDPVVIAMSNDKFTRVATLGGKTQSGRQTGRTRRVTGHRHLSLAANFGSGGEQFSVHLRHLRSIADGAVHASLDESRSHSRVLDAIAPFSQPARGDLRCRFAMRAGRQITSLSIAVIASVGQNMQAGILCELFQNPRITPNIRRRAINKPAYAALFGGKKKRLHAGNNLVDVPSIATGLLRPDEINHDMFVRQGQSQRRWRDRPQHSVNRLSCLRRSRTHEVDCCRSPEELERRAARVLIPFRDSLPLPTPSRYRTLTLVHARIRMHFSKYHLHRSMQIDQSSIVPLLPFVVVWRKDRHCFDLRGRD